jgi:hypothetical protein
VSFFDTLVKLLPKWVLASITLVLVFYIGALGLVAVSTERDVKFWPPEIGPGPKSRLVEEFKALRVDMDAVHRELLDQRKTLNERLHDARSKQAAADSNHNTMESVSWSITARKLEDEIKNIDEKLIDKVEEVKKEAHLIENKFNGL